MKAEVIMDPYKQHKHTLRFNAREVPGQTGPVVLANVYMPYSTLAQLGHQAGQAIKVTIEVV